MKFHIYTWIAVVVLGAMTATGAAQTWDATKDFGPVNPNGSWSYGMGITGTSFTLYSAYLPTCDVSGNVCWSGEVERTAPRVAFNTTGNWLNDTTAVLPPNTLTLHPGPDYGQDTIVQWTAPAAGTYTIYGFFEICDISPTGTFGLIFLNRARCTSGNWTVHLHNKIPIRLVAGRISICPNWS